MIDFIHTMKLCLIGVILFFSSGLNAQTTFTVTNTSDSGSGSLRQAIIDAETSPGADIINVPAGTITLASALPNITEDLTISGVAGTIISGADLYRPFFIGSSDISDNSIAPIVVFQDFTISNGLALGSDAERGGAGAGMGGAIFIGNGDISMDNIVLDNNTTQGGSSGIDQGISNEVVTIGGDGPYVLSGGAGGALNGGSATAGANGLFGGGGGASNTVGGGNGEDGGNGGYGAGGGGGGAGSFSNGDGGLAGTFGGAGAVGFGSFTEGGGGAGLGAAIFLREGTLSVTNSTFSNNTATGGLGGSNAGNGQGKGAAIFNYLGTATVVNPTFDNNQAANAGSSASDNADIYGTFDLVTNAVVDNQPVDQLDIAEGISATFSVATSGSVDTYQWQVDQGSGFVNLSDDANYSGVTSQTLNLTCVPRAFSGNQYRIQLTGALNSVNSEAATLTVANALDLEVSISGEAEVRCTGGEITLTAQSLNTNTVEAYQWIVNGMAIAGATEETFSTTVAVGDEIAVELSEPASCFPRNTSVSESIIVGQIDPENPTVSIDQSLVCPGQSVTLSASYTEGGDAPAFQWTVNGENVGSNQSSLEFIPQEGDEIQVTLTSSEPCLVGSTQVVSELLIVPTAPIDMQPTDAEAVIFGSASAVFTIGVTDPSATIQWQHDRMGNVYQDFADGVFIGSSDPNDQELTASGSTTSTLTLTNIVDHDWHDIHIRAIVSNGVCDYVSAEASLIFVGGTIVVQNENTNGSGSLAAALDLANTFQYLDTESTIIDLTGRSGTIELASPLEVSASVTFLGPGAATLTLSWASGSNIQEGLIQIDRLAEDGTSIEVDGLTLDGTNNAAITDYGIYFAQVDDASYTIKNSVFENFSGEAVIVASGTLSVENITVQNNTRGLLAEDLEYGLSSITNSSFLNNGGDAMVARGTNVVLSGITSSGNLGRGIEIYNQVELDNSSSFNNGVGLLVGGEADVNTLIQNSKFYSNDEDGISLFSLGTITLDNVQSYNNADNGVLVGNTGMSTITGSSIYGNQERGIRDIQAGTLSIISTTISDNGVDGIGAYFSDVLLQNVTITGNGSVGLRGNSDNIMEVNNSIIIGNGTNESNFTTVEFTSTQGHNIYSFAFSPPNLTGITEGNRSDLPIEFVLEDLVTTNDSRYYPLVSNSLIINEGSEAQEVPNTDQQGNPRVGISDPGAVEFQSSPSEENFEVIVTQDVLGCAGENATFSVQLTNGGDAPTLQWLLNGEEVDGATGETFETAVSGMEEISVTATSNVPFRLDAHTKTTDPVTIQFLPVPEISTQPQNLQALNNSPLTFSVLATGIDLTYQWQESIDGSNFTDLVDGASVSGATSPDLTVTASFEEEGYQYRVVLQEVGGCDITSSTASYIIPELGLVLNTNSSGAGSFNQAMTDAITLGSTEADPFIINATGVTGTIDLTSYLGDITEGKIVINGPTDGELILNNAAAGDFIFFELQNDAILEINHITLNGGSSTEAGAILISGLETEAQLIINDSKFTNNTISEIKKGIIHSSSERTVSISINRTEFVGNTATQFLITTPSSDGVVIQLTECLYTNNSVQGIYTEYSQDTFTATDQRIIGNEITYNAFGLEGGLLEGVVFQNNTGDGNFAAIFTTGTIRNSAVVNNEGGLIYQNGGLMENVLVYGNSYSTGLISDIVSFTGGLMNHMTIFDNDAINPVNLNSQDNGQSISNSIILGSDSRPGGVTNGTIVSDFGHNIFGPTTATLDGVTTGNVVNAVVEDVLIATLVDDGVNIPYLLPSPCGIAINAADNAGVLAQDLLGNDRVGIADIGALEYQGTPIDGEEDFTATLSTSVPLVASCAGGILDAAFEAIPSINSGLFQFAWTVNDIEVVGNTANQNISDLEVGDIIEVTITSVAGSCVSSEPLVLNATVESLEVIEEFTAIIDSNVPLVVCDGTVDATLEALPVTGGDFGPFNYSWTLNGQAVGGNEVNLGLTNLAEGDVIEVTITSESPKCLVNVSTTAQITVAPLVLDVTFDAIGINSQNQSALGFTFNDIPGSDLSFSYTISDGINAIDGSGNTEGSSMNFGPFDFTTFNEGNVTLTFSLDGLESCAAIQTIRKELSLPELISAKDIELIEGQTLFYVAASNKSATAEIANLPEWITSETRVEGSVVSNIIVEEGGIDGDIVQGSMLYSEYMAIDAQGNLYFTEDGSYERLDGEFVEVVRLRVITTDGYIRTVAGDEQGYQDGAGTDALFSNVGGIAVDAEGNIYWADRYIHVIRKVTPEGVVTTLAGQYENAGNVTGSFATAQFNQPMELAFGPDGLLYFFEGGNYQIKRIDLEAETVEVFSGSGSRSIDDGAAGVASFSKAENLSIDDQGNIYLEDEGLLRVVSADGSVTTPIASDRIGQGILDGPLSEAQTNSGEVDNLTISAQGIVYFRDGPYIRKIEDGIVTTLLGGSYSYLDGPLSSARIGAGFFVDMAVDPNGIVQFLEYFNDQAYLRSILPAGTFYTGSSEGHAGDYILDLTLTDEVGNQVTEAVNLSVDVAVPFGYTVVIDETNSSASFTISNAVIGADYSYTISDSDGNSITNTGTISTSSEQITGVSLSGLNDGIVTIRFFQFNEAGNGSIMSVSSFKETEAPIFEEQIVDVLEGEALDFEVFGSNDLGARIELVSAPDWMTYTDPGDTVIHIAGNVNGTTGTADGVGTSAEFLSISHLASSSDGTIYIADLYTVRSLAPDGTVTTIAGTNEGTDRSGYVDAVGADARFTLVNGLEFLDGSLYAADYSNTVLRKVELDGTTSTVFGTTETTTMDGPFSSAEMGRPLYLVADGDGNLLVGDGRGGAIKRIDLTAQTYTTLFGDPDGDDRRVLDGFGTEARLRDVENLAYDGENYLYGIDDRLIRRFDLQTFETISYSVNEDGYSNASPAAIGNFAFESGKGLDVDEKDNLFIADDYYDRLLLLSAQGSVITLAHTGETIDGSPETTGIFIENATGSIRDVLITSDGKIYFTDQSKVFEWQFRNPVVTASSADTQGKVGSHEVVIKAIDGAGNETQQTIMVNVLLDIQFNSDPITTAEDGSEYEYLVDASAISGTPLTLTTGTLPDWLSFDFETNALSGTPDDEDVGVYDILITASDGDLSTEDLTQSFILTVTNVNEAPTAISLSKSDIDEDAEVGEIIGVLSTVDEDVNDTHTYEVLTSFNIDGQDVFPVIVEESNLVTTIPMDFETLPSLDIQVRTTDAGGLQFLETFTLTTNNINESPLAIEITTATIGEDADAGSVIGTLSTIDGDNDDSHVYEVLTSFIIDGQEIFPINVQEADLVTTIPMDFETFPLFEIEVMSTDAGGLSIIQSMAITITDVNEAPQIADQILSISEESVPLSNIGFISGFDQENDAITYTILSGNEEGLFTLTETGQLDLTAGDLDFETTPSYELHVNGSDGELSDSAIITVNVTDANDGPSGILLSSAVVVENMPAGTIVGTFTTVDQDADDSHTYEIVSSTMFFVNNEEVTTLAISGENLVTAVELDYESLREITIRVRAEDLAGGQVSDDFTISVTDVNEAPVILDQTFEVDEDLGVGRIVGQLPGVDDEGQNITYTINSGNEAGDFVIETNGNVLVANNLDFETTSSYELLMSGTDGEFSVDATITINIRDVNEAPIGITLSANTISENLAVGTSIGLLEAIDVDANATHTFSLIDGGINDNADFDISGNTLVSAEVFDFETRSTYSIAVSADDGAGGIYTESLTITITDEQEAVAQTITFDELQAVTFGEDPFELSASASSNLTVNYVSSNTEVATISGSTLTIVGAGETLITASQSGNADFSSAADVTQVLLVSRASQSITFDDIPDQQTGVEPITLSAVASSGLPVSYTVTGSATISENVLTITGSGVVTVVASQAGDMNYEVASDVEVSFIVSDPAKSDQVITFDLPEFIYISETTSITLSASTNSGLDVEFELISGSSFATLSDDLLSILSVGTVEISARQSGDESFNPAEITKTLEIKPVFNVLGTITDENNEVFSEGMVNLLSSGETTGIATSIDAEGNYSFSDVKDGVYYIRVVPNDETSYYTTAYGDEIVYQNATPVVVSTADALDIDIQMIPRETGEDLDGDGEVDGKVIDDDGSGSRITVGAILEGAPIEGASIFLIRKSDDKIITEVFSDANGDFKISGIPEGDFSILINIPGVEGSVSTDIIIKEGTQVLMTAMVGEEGIVFDKEITEALAILPTIALEVYPNPVTNFVTIEIGKEENLALFEWKLIDLSGQIILEGKFINESNKKIDLRGISNGVYFLSILDESGRVSHVKISK